jgi:hypothetical protein
MSIIPNAPACNPNSYRYLGLPNFNRPISSPKLKVHKVLPRLLLKSRDTPIKNLGHLGSAIGASYKFLGGNNSTAVSF